MEECRLLKKENSMSEVKMAIVSALEKVFPDLPPVSMEKGPLCGFENETQSFQIAYCSKVGEPKYGYLKIDSEISDFIRVRRVDLSPVRFTTLPDADDNYIKKTPGLFPDPLRDMESDIVRLWEDQWHSLWVDVEPEGKVQPGVYPLTVRMLDEAGEVIAEESTQVEILGGELPEQTLIHTKWFHSDCLATYYDVPVFSEKYWEIVENFIRSAVRRGINMMLTPIHTPPLDTKIGAERPTVQLVDVYLEDGKYSFGFEKLERWVEMCKRCGVKYFEMAHLFTQWGAKCTPKIVAKVNGEEKRIFGWDVSAVSEEYREFTGAYLPALTEKLKELGIDKVSRFHISDEPFGEENLKNYLAAKAVVAPYLKNFIIMDALSEFDYYKSGAVEHPVPSINHMDDFVAAKIPELWTYYCIGQYKDTTNTFMAMSSPRTRILAPMLYQYEIAGFLQWGFNFYYSQYSIYPIDPWVITDGDGFAPAGDTFQVYPGPKGQPVESIRMMVCAHAMQDLRAMQWLESLAGREAVMGLLREELGEMDFKHYPLEGEKQLRLRERINREIEKRI